MARQGWGTVGKMVAVEHWGGMSDRGWGWGSRHMLGFQTGVGFQECGVIPDTGGLPDRNCGVPDRDGGVPNRWWYTRCRCGIPDAGGVPDMG